MDLEKTLGKRIALYIGCIFGTMGLLVAGQLIGSILIAIPQLIISTSRSKANMDAWITGISYISFIGIWIVSLGFLLLSKKNHWIINVLGTKASGNTGMKFWIGILIGFCLNGICAYIAWVNHDINLKYIGFYPVSFILIFVGVLVQSSAEEFVCRGFLYQKGLQYFNKPVIAILTNSLLFAVLHLFNDGVTMLSIINIFLAGLLFSLIVYYTDSIWCAFGVHTAWNFTQNILLGLPNSGSVVPYAVFKLDANTARDSFAYNVSFGIEGTVVADIVLLLACIAIFAWGRKYGKKHINQQL
ncbi:MAG: type II CAAX endopeptidase family protein [bacterium]|nr:type II CAAX endopeptidase family protein [bacterium]